MTTNQEVFDKVARHLLTQNARAVDGDGFCRYRTPDGLKCAVGCLIPDELYDPEMEGKSVCSLVREESGVGKYLQEFNLALVMALQGVHDAVTPSQWLSELLDVASRFVLDPSVLDEFRERS